MMIGLLVTALAAAPPAPAPTNLCGVEEVRAEVLKPCPSYITYDEDGKEVGGSTHD